MGASLHAPPPQIAPDQLVAVNVLESLALDVFTDTDRPNKGGDRHPSLPSSVVSQNTEWNPGSPAQGEQQWQNVLTAWKTPDIVIPKTANTPAANVVDVAMEMLGSAFGWTTVQLQKSDPSVNQLQNDLATDDEPLVWDLATFEREYLAAPLISVA